MRYPLIVLLIILSTCAEKSRDVYPLYKINLTLKPDQNLFSVDLSMNYVSDTVQDTVIFLINKKILMDEFYGRHLIEWIPEAYPENPGLKKLKVIFQPPLKALEYVRINSSYSAPLEQLLGPGENTGSFKLSNANGWFPREEAEHSFFYAINLNISDEYKLADNGHLIKGNWQIISETPANEINLSFVKTENK